MTTEIQAMVYQLQSQIRTRGEVPVGVKIWEDAVCYVNSLIEQLERLKEQNA
ncbi:hypothetical protein LCGC14_1838110 [marine sediment metagenome]|uniref:Uncharacterized protein n=1 Tax=marine sediment metagenome TaxID=412755 RepID=A0A0F9GE32_9ZZZZ